MFNIHNNVKTTKTRKLTLNDADGIIKCFPVFANILDQIVCYYVNEFTIADKNEGENVSGYSPSGKTEK